MPSAAKPRERSGLLTPECVLHEPSRGTGRRARRSRCRGTILRPFGTSLVNTDNCCTGYGSGCCVRVRSSDHASAPTASPAPINHIAIAWDGSRVAARALGDALPLLGVGGRVSVLTVQDDKPLSGSDLAGALASSLEQRGFSATPVPISLGERAIAEALQDTSLSKGAQVLAMGGFGHSRVRDFILGGATRGVLTQLRMPILLAH
jgi:nucleotide-binding universal stress UspA family protein